MKRRSLLAGAVPGALAVSAPGTALADDDGGFRVREVGGFHVGGEAVTLSGVPTRDAYVAEGQTPFRVDPNGDFQSGQIYVNYVRLARPRSPLPVLMWHGGGLTGACFETTPDRRQGWQQRFLSAGRDVYLTDALGAGRASWGRYPEASKAEPLFRTKKELWELFRIGPPGSYATDPRKRRPYADTQFPVAAFDEFVKQVVPRFRTYDRSTQAGYDALVARVGPSTVLTHSAGGPFGFAATIAAPGRVRAHVAIEPSGAPDPATVDFSRVRRVPHLIVWGDHLDADPSWGQLYDSTRRFHDALRAAGGHSTWIDLRDHGHRGNSHMIMMDRDSHRVAGMIDSWLKEHVR
ncbi:esterase [Spongiactinospora rosea]|uniref:Esterase n=1 Tax=Spongiactinospora rosea TaxID=2248750 RepID=A0A366M664_9ACTN|nr:esterase [Spongiactinospora rosea]RBQ21084.1 esterase [Spongiactinospora rosea]